MPTIIDSLVVELGLDSAKFRAGLEDALRNLAQARSRAKEAATDAEKQTEKAATSLERGIAVAIQRAARQRAAEEQRARKERERLDRVESDQQRRTLNERERQVSQTVSQITRRMLELGAALAGAYGITAFAGNINRADLALSNLSEALGISPKYIGAWGNAVRRMGGDAASAVATINAISDAQQKARFGLGDLPIQAYLLGGQGGGGGPPRSDPEAYLRWVTQMTQRVARTNKQEAFSLAKAALFGNEQMAMEALRGGPTQEDFKNTFGPDHAKLVQQFNDAWVRVTTTLEHFGRIVMDEVGPSITDLLDKLDRWLTENEEWIKSGIKKLGDDLRSIPWQEIRDHVVALATNTNEVVQHFGGWVKVIEVLLGLKLIQWIAGLTVALAALAASPGMRALMLIAGMYALLPGGAKDVEDKLNQAASGPTGLAGGLQALKDAWGWMTGGSSAQAAVPPPAGGAGAAGGGRAMLGTRAMPKGQKAVVAAQTAEALRGGGLPEASVAGILGNIQQESGFNPTSRIADQPRFSGEAHFAHGLYQEGGDEWNRYAAWLARNHPDGNWQNPAYQTEFLTWNLKTNYPRTWARLMTAKSPDEAAMIFRREYLKPAEWAANDAGRIGAARRFFANPPKPASSDSIPAFQRGTMDVPHDTLAYLHRGEAVLPADLARDWRNQFRSLLAPMSVPLSAGAALAGGVTHSSSSVNTETNTTNIAAIHLYTQATDARTIANDLNAALRRGAAASTSQYGVR